jgi:gliding motility-associated-like protein
MKRFLIALFFLSLSLNLLAQKEATWWYFGTNAGMSFTGTGAAPVVQTNGKMSNFEGVASISDSKGKLLFYTDGEQVYNRKHAVMANGGSGGTDVRLKGNNSSTQSAVIVQQPVRGERFWIFTVDDEWGNDGFQFSVVDTTYNGGDGRVIQKNLPIMTPSVNNGSPDVYNIKGLAPEKVAAVKHANKVDTWIVNHSGGTGDFYVWLLNARGLSVPVKSSVGPTWATSGSGFKGYSKGYMKFSPDGTKLICAIAGDQSIGFGGYVAGSGRIEIYDFDNLTGKLSNPIIIDKTNIKSGFTCISSVYGVEISPNGRYLYISFYIPSWSAGQGCDGIWQLDLLAGNAAAIGGSCVSVVTSFNTGSAPFYAGGGMQLGPDGKIWIARGTITAQASYLSCISKPNCQGTASTFVSSAITLTPGRSQMGVPTFINSFFNKAEFDWGSNAANLCENALTKLFVTDSTGIDSARWKFDDPSTGASNTAKGFTVYHKFSSPKTYNVFVQLYRKVASADCYADTARKKLTIFANPKPKLGKDTVVCDGESVVLNVDPNVGTFLWNTGSAVPSYSAATKGWHWVDVKVGGCTGRDSFYLDVIQYPKFSLGNDTLFCLGDSVKLTASKGQKYLWSLGDTTATAYAKKAGTVWARASNGACHTYDTVVVSTRAIPKLNLGKDTLLCKGDSVTLKAKTSTSKLYLWSDLSSDSILKVKTSGIYWARIKDTMCISNRDSINVQFQTKASFSLGKDTSFCVGGSFTLNAALSGAKTWKWKDNSTLSTYKASNAGKQWVTVSNGICNFYDTIDLVTYSIPTFSLGKDTTLCEGATFNAINSVLSNIEYTWMGTTVNYSYPITKTGKYYVDLRDLPKKVCKSSDTIKVTFAPPTKFSLGRDTILCVGQNVDLTIANVALKSFKWFDGNTTQNARKNGTPAGGIHWVDIDNGYCISRDSIKVTYRPELFIPSLGPDMQLCDNATLPLDITAANATQYEWQTLLGAQLATTANYTVSTPGGSIVGIISDGFCYKKDTVAVIYKTTPTINLGPDIDICDGASPTLDASPAAAESYLWNTGAITPTITVPNQPKTKYWVRAANGTCQSSDSIWVYFSIPPVIDFGFTDSVFCDAPVINYDFTYYADNTTFTWENGSNTPKRKITGPGIYKLVAKNKCGADSATVNIKIDELGCQMFFPTAFSPNGDGVNDMWIPQGQVIEWVELVIYNRWGEVVHKGDPSKGWNGKIGDKLVPDGVYMMTISYRQATGGYPRLYVKNMILTITN